MKKILLGVITLTVFAITITLFFVTSSSKLDKFMGEWKRIDKPANNVIIKKDEGVILIFSGKNIVAAIYDKHKNILKAYLFSTSVINYIETTDHILINKGGDGEFKRIR